MHGAYFKGSRTWAGDLASNHVFLGGDVTHGNWVAGARLDLLSISDRLSKTAVDEVVCGRLGSSLAKLGAVAA
jgi:hypothetical protein